MELKIIFIAFSENSLGRRILIGLINQGNKPIHVFMASEKAFANFRKNGIKRYIKLHGYINLIWRMYYRLTLRKDIKAKSLENNDSLKKSLKDKCAEFKIPLGYFDNINEDHFVKILTELKPDLIVLGGAPIIKEKVLNIPSIAVLNSHPGILPDAKGMDVVAHSIIHDIPLGVTVFKVDSGIDSGPVLKTRYLEVSTKRKKLHELEALIEDLASDTMLESVRKISTGEYFFEQQKSQGTIFRALNISSYKQVIKKLESGNNS